MWARKRGMCDWGRAQCAARGESGHQPSRDGLASRGGMDSPQPAMTWPTLMGARGTGREGERRWACHSSGQVLRYVRGVMLQHMIGALATACPAAT